MDVTGQQPAEALPVYTEKKWIPNKDDIEQENLKSGPTFAKLKAPMHNTTSFTVLPDAPAENMVQTNASELQQLKTAVKKTFATKPKNEVEAVAL